MLDEIESGFERLKELAVGAAEGAEREAVHIALAIGAVITKDLHRIADALEAIANKPNA